MKALVFSGGGSKGAVHLGALCELEKESPKFDLIVGTSIGAMVGAGYALTLDTQRMSGFALSMNRKVPVNLKNPKSIPSFLTCWFANTFRSLFPRFLFFHIVKKVFRGRRFEDTKIPLAITACNLDTGKLEVFRSGDIVLPLLASMAIPGIFPPIKIGNYRYCDGGVLENLPIRTAKSLGATRILAFHLTSHEPPSAFDQEMSSTRILFQIDRVKEEWRMKLEGDLSALIIPFDTSGFQPLDFRHTPELLEIGKRAIQANITQIREWLQ